MKEKLNSIAGFITVSSEANMRMIGGQAFLDGLIISRSLQRPPQDMLDLALIGAFLVVNRGAVRLARHLFGRN